MSNQDFGAQPAPVAAKETNPKATWSLVAGILSLTLLRVHRRDRGDHRRQAGPDRDSRFGRPAGWRGPRQVGSRPGMDLGGHQRARPDHRRHRLQRQLAHSDRPPLPTGPAFRPRDRRAERRCRAEPLDAARCRPRWRSAPAPGSAPGGRRASRFRTGSCSVEPRRAPRAVR